jgi:hypothetical protein
VSIELGELVYDSNKRLVERVSGLTDNGFEAEEMPAQEFGGGHLMWRCAEFGNMDELDEGLPESCPNCEAPQEAISTVQEDFPAAEARVLLTLSRVSEAIFGMETRQRISKATASLRETGRIVTYGYVH